MGVAQDDGMHAISDINWHDTPKEKTGKMFPMANGTKTGWLRFTVRQFQKLCDGMGGSPLKSTRGSFTLSKFFYLYVAHSLMSPMTMYRERLFLCWKESLPNKTQKY